MTEEIITTQEMQTGRNAARRIAKKWPSIDVEDLEQVLYLWMAENQRHVLRWREENAGGKLYTTLTREAEKYAAKEHQENVRNNEPTNYYTAEGVRTALPVLWSQDIWEKNKWLATQSDALAVMADLTGHFYGLPKDDQEILTWRFRDEDSLQVIGDRIGLTEDAARMRVNRSIDRLTAAMSGEPITWRRRSKQSNMYDEGLY